MLPAARDGSLDAVLRLAAREGRLRPICLGRGLLFHPDAVAWFLSEASE